MKCLRAPQEMQTSIKGKSPNFYGYYILPITEINYLRSPIRLLLAIP